MRGQRPTGGVLGRQECLSGEVTFEPRKRGRRHVVGVEGGNGRCRGKHLPAGLQKSRGLWEERQRGGRWVGVIGWGANCNDLGFSSEFLRLC